MKLEDIRKLADLVKSSGLSEIEVEEDGFRLRISNGEVRPFLASPVPTGEQPVVSHDCIVVPSADRVEDDKNVAIAELDEKLYIVRSPMVGTFYSAPAPDSPNYVEYGSTVQPATVVCIIEAMKVMNEIQADIAGVIADVLVQNGQTVEYGQPLFKIKVS